MHITGPLPTDKRARLVFGLDWRAYPAKGAKAERRRYADGFGATHYVEFKVGQETIAGFALPESSEIRGLRLYSGAARVALHARVKSRQAALVLLQDGERVHLVFVVRGAVRSDEVLTPEAARDRRDAIRNECQRLNLPLVTLGSGQSIGDIDESFPAASLLEDRKAGRIAKVPAAIPVAIPLTVITVALLAGGSKVYDAMQPPPPPPPHEPTYAEKYADAIRHTFASKPPRASALAPMLVGTLATTETNRTGFRFDTGDCGTSGNCTIKYSREGGTFAGFDREATSSMRPITFDPDGLHLKTRGPVIPPVPSVSSADESTWPSEQVLIELLQTPPQRLSQQPFELDSQGYTVLLQPSKPVLQDQTGAGPRPAHPMRQGDWQIDGFRWQAVLLTRLPSNMALDSLKVEYRVKDPVGIHFTAKGKYYVLD
ncbi:Pilin accessory protein (PilO) [Paraburkholderia fungorum]|uniref:Pilin accessory protein (PilO) n=1 Tax=Paraburkholderia fungorum TaxID=134537 RepID=A0A1H1JWD4_9BURK|nr:type 4b pilus protein PilO2 [Paraburkholderia fungorum]SDR54348.1 Pilin accessory protein (PilO) [Paraburkholderia fungorum]